MDKNQWSNFMMNDCKNCYQRQIKLYRSLLDISVDEQKAIEEKDLNKLSSLLYKKREIIQKIEDIKKQTPSHTELDPEGSNLIKRIIKLIERIIIQDRKNESLFKESINQVFLELKHLERAKRARKSYKEFTQVNPHFLDQIR